MATQTIFGNEPVPFTPPVNTEGIPICAGCKLPISVYNVMGTTPRLDGVQFRGVWYCKPGHMIEGDKQAFLAEEKQDRERKAAEQTTQGQAHQREMIQNVQERIAFLGTSEGRTYCVRVGVPHALCLENAEKELASLTQRTQRPRLGFIQMNGH